MAEPYSYTQTQWNTGEPITSDKMMKIENALASIKEKVYDVAAQAQLDANTAGEDASYCKRQIDGGGNTIGINTRITNLSTSISQTVQNASDAMLQINGATILKLDANEEPLYDNLDERFTTIENNARRESVLRDANTKAIKGAQRPDVPDDTLDGRFDDIESAINGLIIDKNALNQALQIAGGQNSQGGQQTLVDRLNAIDGTSTPTRTLPNVISELTEAHGTNNVYGTLNNRFNLIEGKLEEARESTQFNKTGGNKYDSIDARFEAIESEIVGARSGSASIDARLDAIDDTTTNGTLIKRVSSLETTTGSLNTNLGTVEGRVTAAETAIGNMDTAYKAADTAINTAIGLTENDGLRGRITALEAEVDMASTDGERRLDDIEERLDAIDDASTGTVAGLDTRVAALETTVDTATTGLTDRISTLESTVGDNTTGLAATKAIADGAASTASGLATRVTALEGKDTIVVDYDGENSNYTNDKPNSTAVPNPTSNADYLIANDEGKYFYWRYINNNWELISAAGNGEGSGSSSGVIRATLPELSSADVNTDYYIGNSEDGYIHYRYVAPTGNEQQGHYIMILPKGLIADISVDASGNLIAHTLEDDSTNLLADFTALKDVTYTPIYDPNDNTTLTSQRLTFSRINGENEVIDIIGGGGSGGSVYTISIESPTPMAQSIPANSTDPVTITAKVVMKEGNELLGSGATATGQIQYRVYGTNTWNNGDQIEVEAVDPVLKYTIQNNTNFTVDVSKYLEVDKTMQIRLKIVASPAGEGTETDRYLTFTISKVNISIAAEDFDYASVKNSNFQFNYRCFGSNITKTVHFLVDGTDIVSPITTSSHNTVLQQVIPIAKQENNEPVYANGMHTFQVYFVTNTGLRSNTLNYYILYNTDNTRVAPLLGAAAENSTITDGDELIINYSVITIGHETTDKVEINMYQDLNADPIQTSELTDVTNNTLQTWRTFSYPKVSTSEPITVYVVLTATHNVIVNDQPVEVTDSKTLTITINQLITTYTLEPAGELNLLYSYNAYGRSNNDLNKNIHSYTYTNVSGQDITFTGTLQNFNWATDGYVDGTSLTIGGGATYSIDVPIFSNNKNNISIEENAGDQNVLQQDITQKGRTIEIDYEVQSATDLNATIIDCMSNNHRGFRVTPQSCYLLNSSTDIEMDDSGFILNEDQIAAAYLSPGKRTHLVFVIEPWATNEMRDAAFDGEYHQSVNIYVNGEFANTCPYNRDKNTGILSGNDFSTNATITIGSDTCLIKIYSVKLYNRGLTQEQVLQNYKVAPVATRDKLARLEENDILNNAGLVDYEKAKKKYICLLLTGPAPTTQTGDIVPTVSPFKGSPSPAGRRDKKTNEIVGKTESGLTLTKPSKTEASGYTVEFDLQDKIPAGAPAYMGAVGSYCSSNNVQGTSSQKYPIHNLKVYLAKYNAEKTTTTNVLVEQGEELPAGTETVEIDGQTYKVVTETTPAEIKKVKYCLKGKDDEGNDLGTAESTLCWKADYMSTDHANTFNANVADGLFNNRAEDGWPITNWAAQKYQNTVYGIRCLLFQKQGDNPPEFLGDGCLNNDKGNSKTYGLEYENKSNPELSDDGNDTRSQKWEFTNNSEDLGYFKTDDLFAPLNGKIRAKNGFESTYPDEGDLEDDGLEPNYNHLQVLLTWVSKRANYWDETDPTAKAAKKAIFKAEFNNHFILSHVLTYYIFLQYTALCDNRVKNMFLRSDTVRDEVIKNTNDQIILNGNAFPDDDPTGTRWAEYVDTTTGITDPTVINWNTSTFAKWVPVLYDLDSCFGVENVGLIKIRYDADWHYTWKETPQFNGENSVFWLMVEDTFKDEIATLAKSLYNQQPGLNFRTFNQQQIIENQQQISPALTNQDMILKFDKPWSEGFINYAETPDSNGNYPKQTPQYKYLQRGSRAAQKSQFMQQRSMLLSSYYGADEFLNSSIKFRTGVPVGASGTVIGQDDQNNPIYSDGDLTETQITIKANQILYPGVAYGDNKPATRYLANDGKVAANTACTIQATSAVQGNDGIFIYGASVLTDIGDISKFKPLQLDVSAGVNLKRLIIGSNENGYSNNTTNLITGLNKCILLEEINVRNLKQMSTLALTSNGFIKSVYAAGSGIGTISLPQGGVLETIEYGANTSDITILNQGRLTNFSYENSENNNYEKVTRLWIENTPNVPVKDIITARLTARNSGDEGLRAGGLRVIGIDLNLGSDDTFLKLLVSDLAQGTYLTAQGGHIEGGDTYPTITGTIRINSIRRSLLNKINKVYNNELHIIATNVLEENKVEYYNNGVLIYTDYGVSNNDIQDYVKDPAYDIDPVTNLPYLASIYPPDGIPTKPDDVRYKYKFGLYTAQGKYRRFTGWVKHGTTTNPTASDTINSDMRFDAVYPTTEDQYYRVSWYQEINGAVQSYKDVKYGTDLSSEPSPIDLGTMSRIRTGGNSIKVFKGWSCPLGKITGNVNVYGLWEESTINELTENITLSTLNAADIYAVSRLSSARKREVLADQLGTPIMIPMGQEYDYPEGVNITNLLGNDSNIVLDGTTDTIRVYNNITPLALNSDWTLALDYKFLMDSQVSFVNNEYVLASCYKNANNTIIGFKVSLVKNFSSDAHVIQVSWGTQTLPIDYATVDSSGDWTFNSYRNVIVLSHNSDAPNALRVSYTIPNTSGSAPYGANFGTTLTNTAIEWNSNTTITTPLIIGGNYSGTTTTIENNSTSRCPAQGIIYWAKYWDTDLGEINCSNLAAWPHETVPFLLTGYNGASTRSTEQIYANSSLSFAAAQGIGDRVFYANGGGSLDSNGIFGWHQSSMRAFCNNILYNGLPESYRAIISLQNVKSSKRYCGEGTQYNTYEPDTEDYLFLGARREIDETMTINSHVESNEVEASWSGPWAWFASPKIIYQLWGTTSNVVEATTSASDTYYLYRFSGAYIAEDARIFRLANRPTTINNLQIRTSSGNTPFVVQSGDVWVNNDGVAYIYLSENDILNGEKVDIRENNGGWRQAAEWALRTYNPTAGSANEWAFMRVTTTGSIVTQPTQGNSRNTPRLLCPEFTV